jgi:hypothetical protein
VHQDDRRGPLERRLAGQHLVDQDAERVEVGLVADLGGPSDLLGRHIGGRPQGPPGGGQGRGVEVLGDPEVGQLDLALCGDHQVRRLEVAVDHALLVRVVQRVADLDGQVDHLAPGERAALAEDVVEGHPVDVLHREIRGPAVPPEGQEADDVGVAELLEDRGLATEALVGLALLAGLAADDLDGGGPARRLVDRPIDHAHRAGAEDRLDPERTEVFADHDSDPANANRPAVGPGRRRDDLEEPAS